MLCPIYSIPCFRNFPGAGGRYCNYGKYSRSSYKSLPIPYYRSEILRDLKPITAHGIRTPCNLQIPTNSNAELCTLCNF